jgi:DNA polymerase IV
LWGVGPATLERLRRLGIRSVGDLAAMPRSTIVGAVGDAHGSHLHRLANGIDDRGVVPDQTPKSIGHEETFAVDHHEHASLEREAVRMADSVGSRLRKHGLAGRTVTVKVRFHDFRTITRSTTLPSATDAGPDVARAAKALIAQVDPSPGVRLLGVTVTGLQAGAARQLSLDDLDQRSWDDAGPAIDAVRARFGDDAIVPAALAGPDGVRVKRRGDQQWGPDSGGDRRAKGGM